MYQDITLDDDMDLLIEDGDFVLSESIQQEIVLLINTWVGAWKESPLTGVGIINYLNSSGQAQTLRRSISVNLEADGMTDVDCTVNPSNIVDFTVIAHRNE